MLTNKIMQTEIVTPGAETFREATHLNTTLDQAHLTPEFYPQPSPRKC